MKLDEETGKSYISHKTKENLNSQEDDQAVLKFKVSKAQIKQEYIQEIFNRMKFNRHHFYMILSIFLIRTMDGTEIFSLSLASNMIEESFKLTKNSSSYINLIILSGNLFGCLLSMLISNKKPRKYLIKLGLIFIICFGFLSIVTKTIYLFVLFRFIVNIGISLISVASASLMAESINGNSRGLIFNLILLSNSCGEIFISSCLNTVINLENSHDWTKLFILTITPTFIGCIFVPLYPDSLLYFIDNKNYVEAYKVCKVYFTPFQESENLFLKIMNDADDEEIKINKLFKNETILQSLHESRFCEYLIIMTFAFFNSFLGIGIRYILPKTLTHVYHLRNCDLTEENLQENYTHNASVVSMELLLTGFASAFVSFFTGYLLDKNFLKRLKLLRIGVFISLIISILAYSIKNSIDVFACILKALYNLQDLTIDIYSVETFETNQRVYLLSVYNIIQSSSGFLSPYFNDMITNYWFSLNYLFFSILFVICFLLSLLLGREKIKTILK